MMEEVWNIVLEEPTASSSNILQMKRCRVDTAEMEVHKVVVVHFLNVVKKNMMYCMGRALGRRMAKLREALLRFHEKRRATTQQLVQQWKTLEEKKVPSFVPALFISIFSVCIESDTPTVT